MVERPLRIVHVTATFPPYYGGTGTVCYHNARVLAARGHDVQVYTAAWPGEPDDPPGVIVRRFRPVLRIGNAPVLPQLVRLPADAIVHLHFPFYAGAEFVAMARRPYVVTYHQDVELAGWMGRLTTLHDRTIGRQVLQRADRLSPTSLDYFRTSAFADLIPVMGDRLVSIPNGVDTTAFQPGPGDPVVRRRYDIPHDAPLTLFVGSMDRAHYFKGIPTYLRALASLPEVAALLVGEGELRSEYERLAGELGLAQRVRFTGRVPADELPVLYRTADLLVLPSETRGEAFGVVLLEAMASGRPVIASDLPGVRSVITPEVDGLLVRPSDVSALAASIATMIALGPTGRETMGLAGRQKVETDYDWERIGDRLEHLYNSIHTDVAETANGSTIRRSPAVTAQPRQADLPLELRAAIDVIVRETGDGCGVLPGHLLGEPRLVEELHKYARLDPSTGRLLALAARPETVKQHLAVTPADDVVTLVAGPLYRVFRPLRTSIAGGRFSIPRDLSDKGWQELGYQRVATVGVQGIGSVGWAIGERLCRRFGRPDLADRCRIGMLRTLLAAAPFALAAVQVRRYRSTSS